MSRAKKKKEIKPLVVEITKRLAHVNLMCHRNKVMEDKSAYSRKIKHKKGGTI